MNTVEEKCNLLTNEILKVQQEDLECVLENLGWTLEEALEHLEIIHFKGTNVDVEYQIINKHTLEVYKHRKIDVNLHGGFGMVKGWI